MDKAKPVYQYDLDGNFIKKWDSRVSAGRACDILANNISACCNGSKKSAGGYIWRNEEE